MNSEERLRDYIKEARYNMQGDLQDKRLSMVLKDIEEILNRVEEARKELGNYRHYSVPDEKQNAENENIVLKTIDILGDKDE